MAPIYEGSGETVRENSLPAAKFYSNTLAPEKLKTDVGLDLRSFNPGRSRRRRESPEGPLLLRGQIRE